MMGSAAFLVVYAVVCVRRHLLCHHEKGARPAIIWASLIALLVMFVLLMIYIINNQPATALALLVTLVIM